ncbi:MAG: helix-hairpin-helix domain-containing protein [Bacteroidales bacterium]|jgi:competence ComEA-like helix-hairpin-helix protein|nr:helix-hairpin-helix domain-containing protein [Bacteroidales bacterium]
MKKLFTFFAFTKGERRGIVSLLGILAFLMMGVQVMPYYHSKPNSPEFSDENLLQSSPNYRADIGDDTTVRVENLRPQQSSSSQQPRFQQRETKIFTVQINICDTLDLQQIRGVGSKTSHNIINYRERLGGFVRKEQLLEVWGIDSTRYEQIQSAFVIDKRNIRKLNINTIEIRELQRHPYLDYYQAKAIVQTRDKQGVYTNISDILKLALIDQETFDLIKDYLEI